MSANRNRRGQAVAHRWPWAPLLVFAVSMGILEGIVAIYLRDLHYPRGFSFPLIPLSPRAILVESLREAATIVMLGSVGYIAGKGLLERISLFVYIFGIWDIVYYGTLRLIIGWPSSLLTWDILFLIPIVWAGPVLAPLICSCTMILLALSVEWRLGRVATLTPAPYEYVACLTGAFVILLSFLWEYGELIIEAGFLRRFLTLAREPQFQAAVLQHVPTTYHWSLLALGEALILLSIALFLHRTRRNSPSLSSTGS